MRCAEIETLERDGFVVLNFILPPAEVEQARQDLEKLFQRDVDARKENGIVDPHFRDGPAGYTILTGVSHLALDMYNKSAVFDRLLDRMLSHPRVRQVVEAWSGP